mmetsp:Transcript_22379/g.53746  ORF Transcript_22379/g.53746 Transcript_22379/m.53746 type:complete len:605 (+) Transcript_22379:3308-5122(+)
MAFGADVVSRDSSPTRGAVVFRSDVRRGLSAPVRLRGVRREAPEAGQHADRLERGVRRAHGPRRARLTVVRGRRLPWREEEVRRAHIARREAAGAPRGRAARQAPAARVVEDESRRARAQAARGEHLAVAARAALEGRRVVRRGVHERHARRGAPPLRPVACLADARLPPPHLDEALLVARVVEQRVRDALLPVAVVRLACDRRGVEELHRPRHAVEAHVLDQRTHQLVAVDAHAAAPLDQQMQRVREGEDRVVPEGVERARRGEVRAEAPAWRRGVVVVVRRPQVLPVVVLLQVARALRARRPHEEFAACGVPVRDGGVDAAAVEDREEALEDPLAQHGVGRHYLVVEPEGGGHRVAAEPQVAFAADAHLVRRAEEARAVAHLAVEHDHARRRLLQLAELRAEVVGVLHEGLRGRDRQADRERRLAERQRAGAAVRFGRVGEGDARVPPQLLQHVGEHRRREGVGRDDAEEVGVRLAVAQRVAGGGGREDGHAREAGDLRRGDRRARAAGADDRGDALASEGLAREVERAGEARGVVALGVAVGEEQLRVGEQLVGDAVALVVDLAQRLVHAEQRRPRDGEVPRRRRAEGGEEHADAHGGDED